MLTVAFTILCAGLSIQASTTNYCATSLCPAGKNHVACENDGSFAPTCAEDSELVDISYLNDMIVAIHNEYRSRVAAGNLTDFEPAVRMASMSWDSELANLAELNVKTCKMKTDKCRNTDRFKHAGQNVAWYWSDPEPDPMTVVKVAIYGWYEEHHGTEMSHIHKYKSVNPTISQFTTLINDRNTRLGCALVRQTKLSGKEHFFTCNYATTNIKNQKVYSSGPVASQCVTGRNMYYTGLCSNDEPINPNTVT